jgi:hypothetical protein
MELLQFYSGASNHTRVENHSTGQLFAVTIHLKCSQSIAKANEQQENYTGWFSLRRKLDQSNFDTSSKRTASYRSSCI